MDSEKRLMNQLARRALFGYTAGGLGAIAACSLNNPQLFAANKTSNDLADTGGKAHGGLSGLPHHAPRVKRVIYLFQSGGPSHIDLFDYKPQLRKYHGQELPDSVRQGQRLTEMTHKQKEKPCASTAFKFSRQGQSGIWLSELLPHTASIVDEISFIKSLHTEAVNHDPGVTLMNTGAQQLGRPSMGAWLSYGIGSESTDLPAYVVMISQGSGLRVSQPIFARLWGAGILPSEHQGVQFRNGRDPVLYLSDPPGLDRASRRRMLDSLARINQAKATAHGDPETAARIAQYEMAFRMQTSVPALVDLADETEDTFKLYGETSRKPGTYAANCLLARRLAERGVRFIQLYHRGWDQHSRLPSAIRSQCKDHHGRCYTMWLCGGGIRGGSVLGETDDFCYNIVQDPIHIHDVNATILHQLGIDDKRLTHPFQGLDLRLTGVEDQGRVIKQILS